MSIGLYSLTNGAGVLGAAESLFSRLSALESRNADLEQANEQLRSDVARLKRLAYLDPLTGLGNRRHFDTAIATELRRATRHLAPLTLLICDVDHFKAANDTYGHDVGDAVLIEIAGVLRRFCRRGGDLAIRYAGDEFALILPGIPYVTAMRFAEGLRASVRALSVRHPRARQHATLTLSVGGATFQGTEACAPARLVAAADGALYRAKRAGRNRAELAVCA